MLVTCQNSDLVKREEPARPPSPHPLHRSTCHWLAFTMRMMLQRDAVYLPHHASSRSDRPSSTSAGRSCWPSSLGEKSTRGLPFTALFLRPFCCLSPAGTTMYIAAHKKSSSRGASIHAQEHKVQTLSHDLVYHNAQIPNRTKKLPRKCRSGRWARSPVGFRHY
jgi:hypothetical protein